MRGITWTTALIVAIPMTARGSPRVVVANEDDSQRTYDRDRDRQPPYDRDRDRQPPYDRDRDRQPPYDRDRHDRDRYDRGAFYHEHYDRYDNSRWGRDVDQRWVLLARGFNARGDRKFINLGDGRYRRIRIESAWGAPFIARVFLHFDDKTVEAIDLQAHLPQGSGEVISLGNRERERRLVRVIIYTDPAAGGGYSVYAS